ncbi:MAG: flagellar biosynthesis regulator FlaF [Pseudomonadota bacterium]
MHDALQAYSQNTKVTQDPRELEASLLLKAAAKLQAVRDNWDETQKDVFEAILYNRRLWTILASAMVEEDNQLPMEIKNNIANLGVFIMKRTLEIQIKPDAEKLTALININKEIAAGLTAKTQEA